jgi:succinate dehydrogenase / fumarate reductase cytochrome b subunit
MSVQVAQRSIPISFFLKRLHTLTGVLPLGAYLILHLWQNLSVLGGFEFFSERLKSSSTQSILTLVFVLIPLAVHVVLGLLRLYISGNTLGHSRQSGNVRYLLQRVSAVVGGAFLLWHIWQARQLEGAQAWREMLVFPGMAFAYLIGGLAVIFHYCNGLWSAALSLGFLQDKKMQQMLLVFVLLLFVILAMAFVVTVLRFSAVETIL